MDITSDSKIDEKSNETTEGRAPSHSFTLERTGFKYGLLSTLSMIGYFLLMQAFNLGATYELQFGNFVFLAIFIVAGISYFKNYKGSDFKYAQGAALGAVTSGVNAFLFTLFMIGYVFIIDTDFFADIATSANIATHLHPFYLTVGLFFELAFGGFILTLITMQWYKPLPNNN